MPKVGKRQ